MRVRQPTEWTLGSSLGILRAMRPSVCWLAATLLLAPSAAGADPAQVITQELANGLKVRIEVRPGDLEVGVAVAYRVGQRDAPPGYEGLPHLLEHMAFRNTQHLPDLGGYRAIAALGGSSGASTTLDATVYRQSVPPEGLANALWVESDRMAFLVESLRQADLRLEQQIVASELSLRRGADGDPGFLISRLFPDDHPYHVSADEAAAVRAVDLAGLQGFAQRHYRPDRAAVAVVGDVDPAAVLAEIERYFGPIPRPAADPPARDAAVPDVPCYSVQASRQGRGTSLMIWRTRDPGPPGELELLAELIAQEADELIHLPGTSIHASVQRFDLETLVNLEVRAPGLKLAQVQGPLHRSLGELGRRTVAGQFPKVRKAAAFKVSEALEAAPDRAAAWASSAVSSLPSPEALERGVQQLTYEAIIARAGALRGSRPDLWFELEGRPPRTIPDAPKIAKVTCRRL